MIHRVLLSLCACFLLSATARAGVLPPQFDDTIPPATPSGDIGFPTQFPVGKTLLIPVAASNPNGGALIYSATSDNPSVMVRVRTGNPVLNLVVDHPAYTGTDFSGTDLAVSGTLQLMLFREFTPNTTSIIAGLAQAGFYNNVIFHRIIPQFMIQGGDPNGTGSGGPGFSFDNEFKLPLIFTGKGQLAMANAGFDSYGRGTNGSQFFITDSTPPYLDCNHTIFGQLTRGWDVVYNLTQIATTGSNGEPANRPLSDVTITSANITKSNDAVLFLSASGTGTANITVLISDLSTGTPITTGTQFSVSAIADTTNDPVVLTPPADYVAPYKGKATVLLQAQDLECDNISYGSALLGTSNTYGSITSSGNKFQIGGHLSEFAGLLNVEVGAYQTNANSRGSSSSPYDLATFRVGIGDVALTPQPVNLVLPAGNTPQPIVAAAFLDKDSKATPSSFVSATINWGDGIVSSGSNLTITKDPKSGSSPRFLVTGQHAYPNAGIYPIRVVVYGSGGSAAHINGTVTVSAGTVFASGLTVSSNGGTITNTQVASFTDQTPLATGAYKTSIDWGDGVTTSGTVLTLSGSTSFKVLGSHKYTDSANYPVNVTITKNSETATAWSLAQVSKINKPPFMPPLGQVHLAFGFSRTPDFFLTGTTSIAQVAMSGTLVIKNYGNKKSSPTPLRFLYSNDGTIAHSTPISYLGASATNGFTVPSIAPGGQYILPFAYTTNGATVTQNTLLFFGVGSGYNQAYSGKSIIFQLDWHDPITDNQAIQEGKTITYGPF